MTSGKTSGKTPVKTRTRPHESNGTEEPQWPLPT